MATELSHPAWSAARAAEVLEQAGAVLVVDAGWRILYANAALERLAGLPRAHALDQELWEVFPAAADPAGDCRRQLQQAMRSRVPAEFEAHYPPRQLWLEVRAVPLGDGALTILLKDATDRRRARDALAEAEQHSRLLLNSTGEGLLGVDTEGRCTFVNPAALKLLGYANPEELVGRPLHPLIHHTRPDGAPYSLSECPIYRGFHHGEAVHVDAEPFWRRDGSSFLAEYRSHPVLRAGQLAGAVVLFTDVTSRRRREAELRLLGEAGSRLAQSLDFEQTLENIGELVVPALADWYGVDLIESDGTLRAVTVAHRDPAKRALAQTLRERYPPDPGVNYGIYQVARSGEPELVPMVPEELLLAAAQDAEHLQLLRNLALRSWMCVPLIARGQRIGVLTLIAAESGRVYGQEDLVFAQNLAGRIALAIDNARLYEQAQQAVKVREDVLAIVSHDLKSPLSAINLSAGRLWEGTDDHRSRRLLENIQRATTRMNRLLLDLLDMARIGSGQFSVEPEPCSVAGLLTEATELLQPAAEDRGRTLRLCLAVDESVRVECDRNRLLQVLENLLSNAIKFCRPGDTITLRADPVAGGVCIAVEDTGQGIPAEAVPHLFDPYWSGHEHRKLGSGLGLYISRGILRAHGGRLEVESEVGRGSRFYFVLPEAR